MNLRQLEYIVAVDKHRNFAEAAESCFVTQPTLSMMIHKLEEEIGVVIFNRAKQPVEPTKTGKLILEQARVVLEESGKIREIANTTKNVITGELNVDIIPTLGAYLIPLFINDFTNKYPGIRLKIEEKNTDEIIQRIKKDWTDMGILATPLHEKNIDEYPLFYEELYYYSGKPFRKPIIKPEEIDSRDLLMLEEGHCLRSQIYNLCKFMENNEFSFSYRSGNLETLKKLVEKNQGNTILPELATTDLTPEKKKHLVPFRDPVPVREISIVTHHNYAKTRLVYLLRNEIMNNVPESLKGKQAYEILEIGTGK